LNGGNARGESLTPEDSRGDSDGGFCGGEREKKECKRAPTRPKIISKTRKKSEGEAELTFSAKGNFRLYKILNFSCLFPRAVRFEKSY
jgi:hypothetical protein